LPSAPGRMVTTNVSSFWDGPRRPSSSLTAKIVVAGSMTAVRHRILRGPLQRRRNEGSSFGRPATGLRLLDPAVPRRSVCHGDSARRQDPRRRLCAQRLNNDFAVVRLNTNGTLDTTFDGDGIRLIDVAGGNDTARGIAVQSDGKIVVGGVAAIAGNNDFADGPAEYGRQPGYELRHRRQGHHGVGAGADEARALAIQTDGKIVLAGYSHNGTHEDVALVRYNTDGSLDTGFDGDGKRTLAIGSGYDVANAVACRRTARSSWPGFADLGNCRFHRDAIQRRRQPRHEFRYGRHSDHGGRRIQRLQQGAGNPIDGRIVVVGESFNGANNDIAVVRYNSTARSTRPSTPMED